MLSSLLSSVLRVHLCRGEEAFQRMLILGQWDKEQTVVRTSVEEEKQHEREQTRMEGTDVKPTATEKIQFGAKGFFPMPVHFDLLLGSQPRAPDSLSIFIVRKTPSNWCWMKYLHALPVDNPLVSTVLLLLPMALLAAVVKLHITAPQVLTRLSSSTGIVLNSQDDF